MSIIVQSNHHTRIGSWVNSKMSGKNYCDLLPKFYDF